MRKWISGWKAEELLKNKTREWEENGNYEEGNRGPCGELGWTKRYVEIEGKTYILTYDRDGWPELGEV